MPPRDLRLNCSDCPKVPISGISFRKKMPLSDSVGIRKSTSSTKSRYSLSVAKSAPQSSRRSCDLSAPSSTNQTLRALGDNRQPVKSLPLKRAVNPSGGTFNSSAPSMLLITCFYNNLLLLIPYIHYLSIEIIITIGSRICKNSGMRPPEVSATSATKLLANSFEKLGWTSTPIAVARWSIR